MNTNKILIAEDEETLALVLKEKFGKNHFDVKIVDEGDKVCSTAQSFKPDVIILDLMLPKMNGLDVLKELQRDESTKTIPIAVMSNLMDEMNMKMVLGLGVKDYFVKSEHSISEIFEKVASYIV